MSFNPSPNGFGYTVPTQNSAEVQLHIKAAQSGSSSPEKDAKEAIRLAEEAKKTNPSIDVMQVAEQIVTSPVKKQEIMSISSVFKTNAMRERVEKAKQWAREKNTVFTGLREGLIELMNKTNTATPNNLKIVEKATKEFKSNYQLAVLEASKNANSRKFATYMTRNDKIIEEFRKRTNELRSMLESQDIVSTTVQPEFKNASNAYSQFDFSPAPEKLTSSFVDSQGNDRTGPPAPATSAPFDLNNLILPLVVAGAFFLGK